MFLPAPTISDGREEALTKVLHTVDVQDERSTREDRTPHVATSTPAGSAAVGQEPDDGKPAGGPVSATPVTGPALSIAGAARGLGVATATLRSWERRYGLAPSLHTPGGHRRYGSDDLARLQVMHRLVRDGVPAAEAARIAIATRVSGSPDSTGPFAALLWGTPASESQSLSALSDASAGDAATAPEVASPVAGTGLVEPLVSGLPAARGSAADALSADPEAPGLPDGDSAGQAPAGGGRVLPLPRGASATARGLARSALALDAVSCERILDTSFATQGTVDTWDELVRPVLAAIGHRWEASQTGVEVEHMFSAVASAALARHSQLRSRARNTRPVLLASVPDELHDLPLRALHAALAEQRIRALLLGARVPGLALSDAMRRLGPPVVVLWAQMNVVELPELPPLRPTPALILGGPGMQDVAPARPRAHSLVEAIAQVRAALTL
jgi:DNA-binding transcriptional MerR regulator